MNLNIYLYIFIPITFINIYVQVSGESTILMTCNLYEVRGVFTLSFHRILWSSGSFWAAAFRHEPNPARG